MPQVVKRKDPSAEAHQLWQSGQNHARALRWDAARQAHARSARLVPADAVYAVNHARALYACGHVREAGVEAQRAFQLDRHCSFARTLAVECLMNQQRYLDVVALLQSSGLDTAPDHEHHALLGSALYRSGRLTEAMAEFFAALSLQPAQSMLHYNLGLCLNDMDRKSEAAQCFNTALILGIGTFEVYTRGMACMAERASCHWQDSGASAAALAAAVREMPEQACLPTAPFAHVMLDTTRAEQLQAAASNARFLAKDINALLQRRSDWLPGQRRLRVGYVSADFHGHATAILIAEMLERHDRERFEVRLYSHGASDASAMRQRIEGACESFVDARNWTDLELAQRIRADGIDLLIDLKGHTRDHRLPVFAYRPAPVQATFLGFPGTTGADYMDYVIGDPIVTPLSHAADYSEKIAQMPVCYQPNDRQRALPDAPTRVSQGLPADALVLCGFNQPYKISPDVFDSWCRMLKALPDAVLWLLDWSPQALPNLRREAAARGIDPQRLIGATRLLPDAHIARLRLADLFIDTWPYNAHTTASDALWAGVPVVTFLGETFASRVAASLLNAVGLPELACRDQADYEATVLALAVDPQRRSALREQLAQARLVAPLFDSERFTRDIEALYQRIANRHAAGLEPAHLLASAALCAQAEL